jgi:uncharacterized protein (DUF1501 family)
MVAALGEFGRTPRINAYGGRDHWPQCWTVVLAGGPIRGGQGVGASDEIGAYPRDNPVTPAMIAATIYRGLGIDPETEVRGAHGRPMPLVDGGAGPIRQLLA